jgi:hypothetical protein
MVHADLRWWCLVVCLDPGAQRQHDTCPPGTTATTASTPPGSPAPLNDASRPGRRQRAYPPLCTVKADLGVIN